MAMEYSEVSRRKTEIMDIKMSEIRSSRQKKTRRGKKNRMRKLTGKTCNVLSTLVSDENLFNYSTNTVSVSKKVNRMRPTSPKAPMNSTQFLIEDSGNDQIQMHTYAIYHGLSPEISDYSHYSMYDFNDDEKVSEHENSKGSYEPFSIDDTADFIEQEFERDFNWHIKLLKKESHAVDDQRRKELIKLPKWVIIQKILQLETKLQKEEQDEPNHAELCQKLNRMKEENAILKSENNLLKNLL